MTLFEGLGSMAFFRVDMAFRGSVTLGGGLWGHSESRLDIRNWKQAPTKCFSL